MVKLVGLAGAAGYLGPRALRRKKSVLHFGQVMIIEWERAPEAAAFGRYTGYTRVLRN